MLSFFVVILLGACASNTAAKKTEKTDQALVIDFQEYFDKSHVIIYVNRKKEFDGILTSMPTAGYTGQSLSIPYTGEKADIRIIIDGSEYSETVYMAKGRFVGIRYNRGNKKSWIIQSTYEYLYD